MYSKIASLLLISCFSLSAFADLNSPDNAAIACFEQKVGNEMIQSLEAVKVGQPNAVLIRKNRETGELIYLVMQEIAPKVASDDKTIGFKQIAQKVTVIVDLDANGEVTKTIKAKLGSPIQ